MTTLRGHANEAIERFAYILSNAPDFPAEDGTHLDTELRELRQHVVQIRDRVHGADRKETLKLTLLELDEAAELYATGKVGTARRRLQDAERHFREAWEGRVPRTSFVVTPDGVVKPAKG